MMTETLRQIEICTLQKGIEAAEDKWSRMEQLIQEAELRTGGAVHILTPRRRWMQDNEVRVIAMLIAELDALIVQEVTEVLSERGDGTAY